MKRHRSPHSPVERHRRVERREVRLILVSIAIGFVGVVTLLLVFFGR